MPNPVTTPPLITVLGPNSVQQIGYADDTLYVRYNDGRLVRYPGVPVEKYVALENAPSMLRYLREAILPGIKGIEVEEPDGA